MLELIAMTTMLADHIGIVFCPEQIIYRIIGRIAFPIYCFNLVKGIRLTKNRFKYLVRLLITAVITQPIYSVLFQTNRLNAVFTLLTGLTMLSLLETIKGNFYLKLTSVSIYMILATILNIEYSSYGLLLILIYRYCSNPFSVTLFHALLNVIFIPFFGSIQLYSTIGTVTAYLVKNTANCRVSVNPGFRWFYRMFYPLHLFVLLLMKKII